MAVWQKRVTVGTTATRIDDAETAPDLALIVRNRSSNPVFIGGSNVTTSDGFELSPGDSLPLKYAMNIGGLWGIATTAGNRVDRLQISS